MIPGTTVRSPNSTHYTTSKFVKIRVVLEKCNSIYSEVENQHTISFTQPTASETEIIPASSIIQSFHYARRLTQSVLPDHHSSTSLFLSTAYNTTYLAVATSTAFTAAPAPLQTPPSSSAAPDPA